MKYYKLNPDAKAPTRNKATDAGLDLYALEDTFIPVGETAKIKTGIALYVRENHYAKIEDRSSLAAKGLRTGGGVIDHGYNGDVTVVLHNFSNKDNESAIGLRGYYVKAGDKIAQAVLIPIAIEETKELGVLWNSSRGDGGFGSSGS